MFDQHTWGHKSVRVRLDAHSRGSTPFALLNRRTCAARPLTDHVPLRCSCPIALLLPCEVEPHAEALWCSRRLRCCACVQDIYAVGLVLCALLTGRDRRDAECPFVDNMRGLNGVVQDRVRVSAKLFFQIKGCPCCRRHHGLAVVEGSAGPKEKYVFVLLRYR